LNVLRLTPELDYLNDLGRNQVYLCEVECTVEDPTFIWK
jgi:hypothetical protein